MGRSLLAWELRDHERHLTKQETAIPIEALENLAAYFHARVIVRHFVNFQFQCSYVTSSVRGATSQFALNWYDIPGKVGHVKHVDDVLDSEVIEQVFCLEIDGVS